MRRLKLNGQTFGRWTVLGCSGIDSTGASVWKCQCSCGTIKDVVGSKLTSGKSTHCKYCYKKDLHGLRFGSLVVVEYMGNNGYGRSSWRCQCDCGGTKETIASSLLSGATVTCGHCQETRMYSLMQGKRYGRWTVISKCKKDKRSAIKFLCQCDCGTERPVKAARLLDGTSASCGCLRSEMQSGENSHWWKGGITPLQTQIRNLSQNSQWRHKVFQRDDFTCCSCHEVGRKLNAHHIKSFASILADNNIETLEQAIACEELWDIDNGVTLCEKCHKELHRTFKAE